MAKDHKLCNGTMSPDTLHFTANEAMNGKVFGFQLNTFGLARTDRKVIANLEEWDDCLECPEFDHCYKFCVAKLTLEAAVAND